MDLSTLSPEERALWKEAQHQVRAWFQGLSGHTRDALSSHDIRGAEEMVFYATRKASRTTESVEDT